MSRSYSTGYVVKDYGTWRAIINWQGPDKKQHRLSKTTKVKCSPKKGDNRGKGAAEEFLRKWRDELVLQEQECEEIIESSTPFQTYCQQFLNLLNIKTSTRTGYLAAMKWITESELGSLPICQITRTDIAQWEKGLIDSGLSSATAAHYHAFVSQVLKSAYEEGHIRKNPMSGLRAPKRPPKPVNSLSSEQRAEVLAKMDTIGYTSFSMGVRIALLTGMRRGEICALRWQDLDIDTDRPSIHVVHSLTKDKGFKLDTPKDPAGGDTKRIIPIGKKLKDYLVQYRDMQAELARRLDSELDGTLYVLGNPLDGSFKNPEMLGREWRMLASAEGWKGSQGEAVRFHDLRHTFATLAIKDRVMDVMTLSKILGHRDASMTLNIYADALEESKRAGMDALDATL